MQKIVQRLLLIIVICLLILLILQYSYSTSEPFENKTWAIVQYDDRELGPDEQALININKKYAATHNYDYIFIKDGYSHLPPYWIKVAVARDILKQGKHKGVCWIDTDAVFVNPSKSIDQFCEPNSSYSFYMSKDTPTWGSGDFNAGVWFVRNDPHGNSLMDYWMKCWEGVSKDWTKEGSKWKCSTAWSGPSYEQGAFNEHVLKHDEYSKYVKQLSYDYLQSIDPNLPDAFTLHFSGTQKNEIPKFLASWTK